MEFYWSEGLHLHYSRSAAPHPVDILVWDSFWAHAHWDNASVCTHFPMLPASAPAGWQLCCGWGRALPSAWANLVHCHTERKWCSSLCNALLGRGLNLQQSCLGSVVLQNLVTLIFHFYLFCSLGQAYNTKIIGSGWLQNTASVLNQESFLLILSPRAKPSLLCQTFSSPKDKFFFQ